MTKIKSTVKEQRFELTLARDYRVVKANDLIQKPRFQLSAQEQKIILYLISKIKPGDKEFAGYDFGIQEFCKLCGVDDPSGADYKHLKDTLQKLRDRSFWIMQENGIKILLAWLDSVAINPNNGTMTLRLNAGMKPYLLELKDKFTQYELVHTLAMRSQYAIRLYELLKSYEYKGKWRVAIDELKRLLSAEGYERYPDFKRRVLDIALREINSLTDINVNFEAIKKGRKFAEIEFDIKIKENHDQTDAWIKRIKRLG
ncbi:MAG: replication initiation protein [Candidatus Bathyarchaeota archaeon]|nr:replication initiation protein [Candidatus Termitimicrobium sp.]